MTTKRNSAASVIRDCKKIAQAANDELIDYREMPEFAQILDGQHHVSNEDEKVHRLRKAISDKLDECYESLKKLRKLIPTLSGFNAYRARITESTLLDMIDRLGEMLCELSSGVIPSPIDDIDDPEMVSYHSIVEPEPAITYHDDAIAKDDDAPLIVYHELGGQYEN